MNEFQTGVGRGRAARSRGRSRPLRAMLVLLPGLLIALSCGDVADSIRNWGMRQRLQRVERVGRGNLDQMQKDLNLSRARAQELEKRMDELTAESAIRGRLAWQLARRFCLEGRYEVGTAYARRALAEQPVSGGKQPADLLFERALPYFREALAHSRMEPNLLYDAGLCYANAARALGWESDRLETAVFLFEALQRAEPKGTRADYQLALIFGKSTNARFRDVPRAIALLEAVLGQDEYDIAARFALAHLLAASGEWNRALAEYGHVQAKLRALHNRGNLPGDPTRTRQYRSAAENAQQLQICIQDRPGCQLRRPARR